MPLCGAVRYKNIYCWRSSCSWPTLRSRWEEGSEKSHFWRAASAQTLQSERSSSLALVLPDLSTWRCREVTTGSYNVLNILMLNGLSCLSRLSSSHYTEAASSYPAVKVTHYSAILSSRLMIPPLRSSEHFRRRQDSAVVEEERCLFLIILNLTFTNLHCNC